MDSRRFTAEPRSASATIAAHLQLECFVVDGGRRRARTHSATVWSPRLAGADLPVVATIESIVRSPAILSPVESTEPPPDQMRAPVGIIAMSADLHRFDGIPEAHDDPIEGHLALDVEGQSAWHHVIVWGVASSKRPGSGIGMG
jgi:hypothetical protein